FSADHALLEFMAISGRSYSIQASTDLKTWTPIQFRIPSEGASAQNRSIYQATDVRVLRVEALVATPPPPSQLYFKALVQ
ncbi:MAG TPA: hypothetical protein VEC99_04555, partial [Clostridia bacterium]|nr:hypothetical protein [Clostridia bacterium]